MANASTRYRCHACGATFTAWAPAQRHSDAERHHRLDITTDEGSPMTRNDNRKIRRKRSQGEDRMGPPRPNTVEATPSGTKLVPAAQSKPAARRGNQ